MVAAVVVVVTAATFAAIATASAVALVLDFCLSHFPVVPLSFVLCIRKNLRASKMIRMFYRRRHHMTHTEEKRKHSKKSYQYRVNSHKSVCITHRMLDMEAVVVCTCLRAAAISIVTVVALLSSVQSFSSMCMPATTTASEYGHIDRYVKSEHRECESVLHADGWISQNMPYISKQSPQ